MPVTQPADSIDLKRRNRLTQGHKLRSSTSWLGNSAGSKIAKSAKSLQKLLRPELLKMVSSKVHAREPSLSTERSSTVVSQRTRVVLCVAGRLLARKRERTDFRKKAFGFRGGVFIARRAHQSSLVIPVRLRRITTMLRSSIPSISRSRIMW